MAIAMNVNPKNQTPIYIGIDEQDRQAIAQGLSEILADTYLLYLKTHNFHWNVIGPLFQSLHTMFETQYLGLATAVDNIAERIRALGFPAPGTFAEYQQLSILHETPGVPPAETMLAELVDAHESISRRAKPLLKRASSVGDEPTVDLLTTRIRQHEETAWMLRSRWPGTTIRVYSQPHR